MNTGQMMITIAAMMLLTVVILRVNTNFFNTSNVMYETKFGVMAVSFGTSIIEEATSKAYDANTVDMSLGNINSLTNPNSLGKETGESYPDFDDFDDYNGYTKSTAGDNTFQSAVFNAVCIVKYVDPSNLNVFTNTRKWHKKMIVTITSPSMVDTVRMSTIFSYWYFR
ncbi:MAG: hypothetical protein M0P71_05215 [Melioribacteraceae bacterium]|nr:hypothetical protein [Melioribacteraceae bacterium]